jgi:hypothetical protein
MAAHHVCEGGSGGISTKRASAQTGSMRRDHRQNSLRFGDKPCSSRDRMLTAELKSVMSSILKRASAMSMAAYVMMLVFSATGSGAAAQEKILTAGQNETVSEVAQPAANLADLVAAEPETKDLSDDLSCLASAIYFESRNEPLDGQLAVARVIVNRSKSGRSPNFIELIPKNISRRNTIKKH